MKTILFTPSAPSTHSPQLEPLTLYPACPLTHPSLTPPNQTPHKETIRHILLGPPGAVRQTIHLLHTLRYAETVLWSPVLRIEEPLTLAPEQGEAMSLLRKSV